MRKRASNVPMLELSNGASLAPNKAGTSASVLGVSFGVVGCAKHLPRVA